MYTSNRDIEMLPSYDQPASLKNTGKVRIRTTKIDVSLYSRS